MTIVPALSTQFDRSTVLFQLSDVDRPLRTRGMRLPVCEGCGSQSVRDAAPSLWGCVSQSLRVFGECGSQSLRMRLPVFEGLWGMRLPVSEGCGSQSLRDAASSLRGSLFCFGCRSKRQFGRFRRRLKGYFIIGCILSIQSGVRRYMADSA